MDDEYRAAERSDDPSEYRRALRKAPVLFLIGLRQRLDDRRKHLAELLGIVDHVVPRCRCGEIAEGLCADCIETDRKADALLQYWKQHGAFHRWVVGEQYMVKDAQAFFDAWWESRGYAREPGNCDFPECTTESVHRWYRMCHSHVWLHSQGQLAYRGKKRGN